MRASTWAITCGSMWCRNVSSLTSQAPQWFGSLIPSNTSRGTSSPVARRPIASARSSIANALYGRSIRRCSSPARASGSPLMTIGTTALATPSSASGLIIASVNRPKMFSPSGSSSSSTIDSSRSPSGNFRMPPPASLLLAVARTSRLSSSSSSDTSSSERIGLVAIIENRQWGTHIRAA